MKLARHAVALVLLVPSPVPAPGQSVTTTIRAGTVLDGRGGTVRNQTIVIEGARIARLEPAGKTATYDLGGLTVLPGGIDTHVHITSHFDANGRAHNDPGSTEPLQETALYTMENEARAVVHAHAAEAARRAVMAGCTTIEHGVLLDDATLDLMAEHGTYFDPNLYLVFQNYFDNKARFLGIENYTEEGYAYMHRAVPLV